VKTGEGHRVILEVKSETFYHSDRVGILYCMSARTLGEIKASIEKLELADQVRLLEYLTPKIADAVLASQREEKSAEDDRDAIQKYRSTGARLSATSVPGAPSLTEAVSQMRR
jgi:hypothetical protein